LLGLLNSHASLYFLRMLTAADAYQVGYVRRLPYQIEDNSLVEKIKDSARKGVNARRHLDEYDETCRMFRVPFALQGGTTSFTEACSVAADIVGMVSHEVDDVIHTINHCVIAGFGLSGGDAESIVSGISEPPIAFETQEPHSVVSDSLLYAVGTIFGRWDVRIGNDTSLSPRLAGPLDRLPVCPPATLVGPDRLPAQRDGIASEEWMRARPDAITAPSKGSVRNPTIPDSEYPLTVNWDGILVDDPEHEDDILRRVRDVLDLLWGEQSDAIEGEACEILGTKDLRTYYRNPRKFFDYHIKRYSKSRRKAPIYWLLQSPKRNYGLWLYYHRLNPDTLFKALYTYVEPKVRLEESHLEEYEARRRSAGTGGREAKQAEKAVEKQEELLTDLREFRDRLDRAAKLHLRPDLNDGVVLNIAPLHELVPWKEAKSKWNELLSGKYEWSSIGKQLREKGIV
jgi:hypothetical protein